MSLLIEALKNAFYVILHDFLVVISFTIGYRLGQRKSHR